MFSKVVLSIASLFSVEVIDSFTESSIFLLPVYAESIPSFSSLAPFSIFWVPSFILLNPSLIISN